MRGPPAPHHYCGRMDDTTTPVMDADTRDGAAAVPVAGPAELAELLIEEISIDGMCGVY